ncbi:unnamed protein product, partial [Darwinula stevensoni]
MLDDTVFTLTALKMRAAFFLVLDAFYWTSISLSELGLSQDLGDECDFELQSCTLNFSECALSHFEQDIYVCQCRDGYVVENSECSECIRLHISMG